MPYTEHADVYAAIHEDGLNKGIEHIQRKRPSLFNYGTDRVAERSADLLCRPIDAAPEVTANGNPLVTTQDPVPVFGTDGLVALEYGFQIPTIVIDFAPGDELPFPEDTDLAVGEQEFGIGVEICAGLACPGEEELLELIDQVRYLEDHPEQRAERGDDPIVPRPRDLHCFCLFAFLVGTVDMGPPGIHTPTFTIDETPQFHTHDIAITAGVGDGGGGHVAMPTRMEPSTLELPPGFRRSLECYLELTIELGVLPEIADAVANVVPRLVRMLEDMFDLAGTTLDVETPTGGAIPYNPAIQGDELRIDLDVTIGRPSS